MKVKNYIALLLSVYMFTLMIMPCNDTCNSHQHDTPASTQQAQDHHDADNDICSPFCFCNCCATAMTTLHCTVFNIVLPDAMHDYTLFSQSIFSQELSSIWQPPKLS